jgi:quercetin dioxygenase-like cupin family protein
LEIKRNGSQPSTQGAAENFTGGVLIDLSCSDHPRPDNSPLLSLLLNPAPRTAWHTHPSGQTLIVTIGLGWTQCEGEPKVEIRPGAIVTCPANNGIGRLHSHGHFSASISLRRDTKSNLRN